MTSFLDIVLLLCSISFARSSNAARFSAVRRQPPSSVPQYVVDYAPVNYMDPDEKFMPADISAQLPNTQPEVNFTLVSDAPSPLTLDNLNDLSNDTYLTSVEDPTQSPPPSWLLGVTPDGSGVTQDATSCAVIIYDHQDGTVDAFYFYFYAFDFGGVYEIPVIGKYNIGNHVGDWEHNMIRFKNGVPSAMWFSEHAFGEAVTYDALEKYNNSSRPVNYVANGTHANYATAGGHNHAIPDIHFDGGIVKDNTGKGVFWDPVASAYYFSYNPTSQTFTAYDESTPVNWLYFLGHWGDKQYPKSDPRQSTPLNTGIGQKYVNGPTGPIYKQLNRTDVCPTGDPCIVMPILVDGS